MGEVVHTSATIGSNVEQVTWRNLHFLMWDIGGQVRQSELCAVEQFVFAGESARIMGNLLRTHRVRGTCYRFD